MKKDAYKTFVCKRYCEFYKPGSKNNADKCGSYNFIKRNLTPRELKNFIYDKKLKCDFSEDGVIYALACSGCNFLLDGCAFRAGLNSPPCGGYPIVENLLK